MDIYIINIIWTCIHLLKVFLERFNQRSRKQSPINNIGCRRPLCWRMGPPQLYTEGGPDQILHCVFAFRRRRVSLIHSWLKQQQTLRGLDEHIHIWNKQGPCVQAMDRNNSIPTIPDNNIHTHTHCCRASGGPVLLGLILGSVSRHSRKQWCERQASM